MDIVEDLQENQVKLFFDSVIRFAYGKRAQFLNLNVLYEDLYEDLLELHKKILSIKKGNNYPLSLFKEDKIYYLTYGRHDGLHNCEFKRIIECLTDILSERIWPYGFHIDPKHDLTAACFETYFVEDFLKHNNQEIIIFHKNNLKYLAYDVKNKIKFILLFHPETNYAFDLGQKVFDLCIQKHRKLC